MERQWEHTKSMNRVGYQLNLNQTTTWYMEKLHFHDSIEILLCLSDGGKFFINNREYTIRNGSLFILKGCVLHRSMSDHRYKRYVMHISMEELGRLSSEKSNFVNKVQEVSVHTLLSPEMRDLLVEKLQRLETREEQEFGGDLMKNVQLVDVLVTLFRAATYDCLEEGERIVSPEFTKIEHILLYIQEHCHEKLSLDELSTRFFINKYHLCHVFKNSTGLGVAEYVTKCRMTKARDLLRRGHRVHDVAERVGYRNDSHFTRTFRKFTGTSPKAYADQYGLGSRKEAGEIFLETAGALTETAEHGNGESFAETS